MRVQIVGGVWRGQVLTTPKVLDLRPTSHRVRKALFDILGARVLGATVLDLFAGTGALGLEALSRGASAVVFVEVAPACTTAIRRSVERFGVPAGATVEILTQQALTALRRLGRGRQRFDLILMDPPYAGSWGKISLRAVAEHATLAPSGLVVLEQARRTVLPEAVGSLRQVRMARYGDTTLAFYQG